MITQDDLLTLHHLRAAWTGGAAEDASAAGLAVMPGRAEGRVAHWSFCRTAKVLARSSRRPVKIGEGLVPSADERQLLRISHALAEGDWSGAEDAALWLVRRGAASMLVRALAPAACALYGRAAPRRAKAATA